MEQKRFGNYFSDKKSLSVKVVGVFLALLFVFAVAFFIWSIMKYNDIMEQKQEKDEYISSLNDSIDELEYLVDAPLDDAYKIRMAREKLGMCFPEEIIFHTELD